MTRRSESTPRIARLASWARRPRVSRWIDVALAALAGLAAVVVAMWATGVRPRDINVPWGDGDLLPVYSYAENLARGHWFLVNPDLGFPGFQDHGHFPVTDLFSIAQIAVLSHIAPSPLAAVNLFILGAFFTVAAAMYGLLRWESVNRPFALGIALAFAVLPWHFARSAAHVFLASYLSVPLALFLVGLIARRRLERPGSRWLLPVAITAAIVVGANGVYYALMTTILMGVVLVVVSVRPRWSRPGWRTLVMMAAVPLTTLSAVATNKLSISTLSTGVSVFRYPAESYLYGGNLATLFFPSVTTRSGRALGRFLNLGFPNNGTFEGDALLSLAGVLAVVLACVVVALRWAPGSRTREGSAVESASFWPALFLLTTAFFAIGGLGALFSFWISNDIRAWGRYSIFVVGIAFLITGRVISSWWRLSGRVLRVAAALLGVVIAVSAVVDLSAGAQRLPIERDRALNAELREYVDAVEAHTSDGCPILELPLMSYPESPPINRMSDYSHLWTYVYSDDLRWSYGAMKGTALGDWGTGVEGDPSAMLGLARQTGFCGVQVDTFAFASLADEVDEQRAFGDPDIVSSSGRWAFFDLTGPLPGEFSLAPSTGFTVATQTAGLPVTWWMTAPEATVSVYGAPGSRVEAHLTVSSPPCGAAKVSLAGDTFVVNGSQERTVSVVLDADGTGTMPVAVGSAACAVDGEKTPVLLGLEGSSWAPTLPGAQN